MGDNNENPTVQEIPADKCVQRTMAVGFSQTCCERTFPKHGDENEYGFVISIYSYSYTVKEHSPNMGTKMSSHAVNIRFNS